MQTQCLQRFLPLTFATALSALAGCNQYEETDLYVQTHVLEATAAVVSEQASSEVPTVTALVTSVGEDRASTARVVVVAQDLPGETEAFIVGLWLDVAEGATTADIYAAEARGFDGASGSNGALLDVPITVDATRISGDLGHDCARADATICRDEQFECAYFGDIQIEADIRLGAAQTPQTLRFNVRAIQELEVTHRTNDCGLGECACDMILD